MAGNQALKPAPSCVSSHNLLVQSRMVLRNKDLKVLHETLLDNANLVTSLHTTTIPGCVGMICRRCYMTTSEETDATWPHQEALQLG